MLDPLAALGALNSTLTAYEKVSKMFREWVKTQPDTPEKQEAAKNLKQAEDSLQLAKAELAKGFGYPLCRNHFPPGILVYLPEEPGRMAPPRTKCETCGDITPKDMPTDLDDNPLTSCR